MSLINAGLLMSGRGRIPLVFDETIEWITVRKDAEASPEWRDRSIKYSIEFFDHNGGMLSPLKRGDHVAVDSENQAVLRGNVIWVDTAPPQSWVVSCASASAS